MTAYTHAGVSPGSMLVIQTENGDRTASTSFICRAVDTGSAVGDEVDGGGALPGAYEHTLGRGGLVAAGEYDRALALGVDDDDAHAAGADMALPSGLPGVGGAGAGEGGERSLRVGNAPGAGAGFTHTGTATGALARPVPMTRYQ